MNNSLFLSSLLIGTFLMFAGCGSGSSVTLPQQKTATLIFSASTSAALPTAVRIIRISARIPAGVTVPLKINSNREVDPGALVAYKPGSTVFGSYSAPLLMVSVSGDVTPSSASLGINNVGDFAGVKVNFPPEAPLTEANFTGINPTFPDFAASGFTTSGGFTSSVILTNQLKPAMRVTF